VLFAKTQILADSKLIAADNKTIRRASFIEQLGQLLSQVKQFEAMVVAKPAFVFAGLVFVVLGGIGYKISQNSLPGDSLYSVRSVIEKATTGSDALASFTVAQRRLEDLRKVVEGNMVKNLSQATQEFNQSVAEVSKSLLALVENEPQKALQVSRELVQLQKGKAEIEQILGAVIGEQETSELTNATKILLESELSDLLKRTLTDEQEELLKEAIGAYQAQNYQKALENIWTISN